MCPRTVRSTNCLLKTLLFLKCNSSLSLSPCDGADMLTTWSPSHPVNNIWAMMTIQRIRRMKIIRPFCVMLCYDKCAQWQARKPEGFTLDCGLGLSFLPAALRAAQICRYLVYSEADFEVFRPAGATHCTDGGEIWQVGGDQRSPPPCQISPPSVQRQGCSTPKIEIFTQIWPKSGI